MRPEIVVRPPGPQARRIIERDRRVISQSMVRNYPLVLKRAYGVNLEDVDGNRFLDFNSGVAVMSLGWSHPRIVEAVERQVRNLTHAAFLDFYSDLPVRAAELLVSFMPQGLNRVYYTNSGAETIEAALKLSRYYTERKYFISFYGGFHGRTYGALSLTSTKVLHRKHFGPFLSVIHAPYPNPYRWPKGPDREPCEIEAMRYIEEEIFKSEVAPEEIAAVFVEPIQGEGGYVVPPKRFLQDLRKLCSKYGILLVADEIQSGCFRTGKFLASDHFDIKPDIVCLAKALGGGLPLGAAVSSEKVMSWPPGSHASTFGANLASAAACEATLNIMKEKGFGRRIEEKGNYIMKRLRELQKQCPLIGDVRGLGLMIGIELVEDQHSKKPAKKSRDSVVTRCFENGLAVMGAGESVIRLAPPLIMEYEDIDIGLSILERSIHQVQKGR
ncbi:MAG TPA: acetyl ornithine aminotransferase family protein [Candidatus Bathyarchaeia archaeon]|nr:acetyl ornithine aminotransferase family protein [Candidatus Bathyarchaeia archaeon]